MKGFARALYLLSLSAIFLCLPVITGLVYPGPAPELTAAWLGFFNQDTALAAFAFAALGTVWLGVMLPVLFLGKGPVSAACLALLLLLLGAAALSGSVMAVAFWMVLFFVFCVTHAQERRRAKARTSAAAAGEKAGHGGEAAVPPGRATPSGQELRRYAESLEDKAIQSSRTRR